MIPGTLLLPILRSSKWKDAHLAFCTPLIQARETVTHNPWLSFAHDSGTQLFTITRKSLPEEEKTKDEIVLEALQNLAQRALEWEISARRADGTAMVLTCRDERAAEAILVPGHMEEAQSILGANEIVAAIPVSGIMIVQTAHPQDPSELSALIHWAQDNFQAETDAPLTPHLITVQMGTITGMLCNEPNPARRSPERQAPRLLPHRYDESTRTLLFQAMLGPQETIPPWEVQRLRERIDAKQMVDGRVVDQFEVVCSESAIAQRASDALRHLDVLISIGEPDANERLPFLS